MLRSYTYLISSAGWGFPILAAAAFIGDAPEEDGQEDQQMEDAPQVQQQDSPYLFRRPRRESTSEDY
ncbi:hypothetical protein VN97_g2253 [Penicillium thymicola]|uniref:Uncharacterized protein n=1 Tax=Penicillium thymicola TaxID=293382 RepID=A0AAI9TPL9_PENTH|nr:hypothetical protein VN97_g2253 [Penicillium thymicola]